MTDYSIVSNAKFNPMSLQELLVPFEKYGAAYKEQEDALAELDTKASVWENMANEQSDPVAYAQYKRYADALKIQRDSIAEQGLNIGSRKAMLDLKSRYAKEISPIETAYNNRIEEMKLQRQAFISSNGKVRFSRDAKSMSLDDFLNGKSPEYSMMNLDDAYKEAAAGAAAISGRHFDKPTIHKLSEKYDYYTQVQGMPQDEALAQLEEENSEFGKFANELRGKYQYSKYDSDTRGEFDSTVRAGIISGLVSKETNTVTANPDYESPSAYQNRMYNYAKSGVKWDSNQGRFVEDEDAPTMTDGTTGGISGKKFYDPDGDEYVYNKSTGRYISVDDPTISYSKDEWASMASATRTPDTKKAKQKTEMYAFAHNWGFGKNLDPTDSAIPKEGLDRALARGYSKLKPSEANDFWSSKLGQEALDKYGISERHKDDYIVLKRARGGLFDDEYIIRHKNFNTREYLRSEGGDDLVKQYDDLVEQAKKKQAQQSSQSSTGATKDIKSLE